MPRLRAYFYSGWAFLIPYLLAYLLYYALKWPVNPSTVDIPPSTVHRPPSLLLLYWALHAVHVVLGCIALREWWQTSQSSSETRSTQVSDLCQRAILPLLPWGLLALIFYIPGAYLEFPADPWAHFARINEWSSLDFVGQHSAWNKSSYFLAYSFIGQIALPMRQLKWLDIYAAGCCLLLCWQYFRLAQAVDLGKRASFLFVLLNVLTFGNSVFGFFRYYGTSSSVFAQLGAVALVRVALDLLRGRERQPTQINSPNDGPHSIVLSKDDPGQTEVNGISLTAAPLEQPRHRFRKAIQVAIPCLPLLILTAFSHVQGLGIAGLGMAEVIVWRLIAWRRTMIGWLALAAMTFSATTVLWYPRHPALDGILRPQGWLNSWYGFDLFSWNSAAFDRAAAIVGIFGLLNLIAGFLLLRRNHVVAWLTIGPILALCLPFVAIPFANALVRVTASDIIVFHRLLFEIPAGLALVVFCKELALKASAQSPGRNLRSVFTGELVDTSAFAAVLVLMMAVPAGAPFFNRAWNILSVVPDDLQMRPVVAQLAKAPFRRLRSDQAPVFMTTSGLGFITWATGNRQGSDSFMYRKIFFSTSPAIEADSLSGGFIAASKTARQTWLLIPQASHLESSVSLAGYLSHHWPPQQVALDYAAAPELETIARKWGGRKFQENDLIYYIFSGKSPSGDILDVPR